MSHFKEICFSNFTNTTNETLQIGKFEALHPLSLVACTHKESQWQSKIQQLGVVCMNHPKYTYTCWFHSHVRKSNIFVRKTSFSWFIKSINFKVVKKKVKPRFNHHFLLRPYHFLLVRTRPKPRRPLHSRGPQVRRNPVLRRWKKNGSGKELGHKRETYGKCLVKIMDMVDMPAENGPKKGQLTANTEEFIQTFM